MSIGETPKVLQTVGIGFRQAHKYERGLSRISAGRLFHIVTALDATITFFFATDNDTSNDD